MISFAICVESSHDKGMGHLFRALNLAELFAQKGERSILFLNDDPRSISLLKERKVLYETVDLFDHTSDWESKLIRQYNIDVWVNDRLDTARAHADNVRKNGTKLVSLDDRGEGAEIADINFGGFPFNFTTELKGARTFKGLQYLVLSKEIDRYRRERDGVKKILVTFGGSDTYGVTIKIVEILKKQNIEAQIIAGPCFEHSEELKKIVCGGYGIVDNPKSLIEEFYGYDLAITGGGITPFEANASGLPCIVVANEPHEIANGLFLDTLGSSVFAGYRENIQEDVFLKDLNFKAMSRRGLAVIKTGGAENIYKEISFLWIKQS